MNKELFNGLIQSLNEAIAYSKGELQLKTTATEKTTGKQKQKNYPVDKKDSLHP